MIPKIIHYCWFGRGEMPPLMKKCLKSWKKHCPDWKVMRWDEDTFDVNTTLWTKQAYEAKKYAFVADYVRLWALNQFGGVYMDTDQELIKPLTPFLSHRAFLGFMDNVNISAGVIGAERYHPLITELLGYYEGRRFLSEDGTAELTPNTNWMTDCLIERGLKMNDSYQELGDVAIYPQSYFCPTSCIRPENLKGPNTVAIHHWAMTWRSKKAKKDFAKMRRHGTWWYRAWEKAQILPQRTVRLLFGDETVENWKKKLRK